jgi:hypothetical protein
LEAVEKDDARELDEFLKLQNALVGIEFNDDLRVILHNLFYQLIANISSSLTGFEPDPAHPKLRPKISKFLSKRMEHGIC